MGQRGTCCGCMTVVTGYICVTIAYLCMIYADYGAVFWMILPTFHSMFWKVFHVVAFNVLLSLAVVSHFKAMMSDPGFVFIPKHQDKFSEETETVDSPEGSNDSDNGDTDIELGTNVRSRRYGGQTFSPCSRCEAFRPPRAHHCRVCRRCVRKMDHHCPWINNCVGEYNQKFFLQFVFYVGILSIYGAMIIALSWIYRDDNSTIEGNNQFEEITRHYKVMHTFLLSIECSLFGLFVLAVSCDQMYSIFKDETMIEALRQRGAPRRRKKIDKWTLLAKVCGSNIHWTLWPIPCISLPTKKNVVRFAKKTVHVPFRNYYKG